MIHAHTHTHSVIWNALGLIRLSRYVCHVTSEFSIVSPSWKCQPQSLAYNEFARKTLLRSSRQKRLTCCLRSAGLIASANTKRSECLFEILVETSHLRDRMAVCDWKCIFVANRFRCVNWRKWTANNERVRSSESAMARRIEMKFGQTAFTHTSGSYQCRSTNLLASSRLLRHERKP